MFHVKLVARPDTRMVEVPLEIDAELPRDFDGAALLASSGLPRKVKIKAPKDALKLSTAYRADTLLGDIVRVALRGTPQDVARVQDAARVFIKNVRERRRDGFTLLVQSNGRGKIDVAESMPTPPPRAGAAPGAAAESPAAGTLADRVGALERRLSQLESGFAKFIGEDGPGAHATLESRLSRLEAELGVERARVQERLSDAPEVAELPTPLAEPRGRTTLRRGTAVEAYAEGLRTELRGRATQQLGAADRAQHVCDKAARLFAESVRDLGASPAAPEGESLRNLATEAAARQRALHRFVGEVDIYAAAELPIAERLLQRLQPPADAGALFPDPAPALQALGENLLRAGNGSQLLAAWVEAAAPLCGWKLIEPRAGQQLVPDLHEDGERAPAGSIITRLLVPGARRSDGSIVARARVTAEGAEPLDATKVVEADKVAESAEPLEAQVEDADLLEPGDESAVAATEHGGGHGASAAAVEPIEDRGTDGSAAANAAAPEPTRDEMRGWPAEVAAHLAPAESAPAPEPAEAAPEVAGSAPAAGLAETPPAGKPAAAAPAAEPALAAPPAEPAAAAPAAEPALAAPAAEPVAAAPATEPAEGAPIDSATPLALLHSPGAADFEAPPGDTAVRTASAAADAPVSHVHAVDAAPLGQLLLAPPGAPAIASAHDAAAAVDANPAVAQAGPAATTEAPPHEAGPAHGAGAGSGEPAGLDGAEPGSSHSSHSSDSSHAAGHGGGAAEPPATSGADAAAPGSIRGTFAGWEAPEGQEPVEVEVEEEEDLSAPPPAPPPDAHGG